MFMTKTLNSSDHITSKVFIGEQSVGLKKAMLRSATSDTYNHRNIARVSPQGLDALMLGKLQLFCCLEKQQMAKAQFHVGLL